MKTSHTGYHNPQHRSATVAFALAAVLLALLAASALATTNLATTIVGQNDAARRSLTPLQLEIEKQLQRLSSLEVEERRDAVMRLAALRHPDASRAAVNALTDLLPIVRATAAGAVLWLPPEQSVAALAPLLDDKTEFVRQEVAYALGKTRSKIAVAPLLKRLEKEKKNGVRGAVVVALGEIGDESAVVSLAQILAPETSSTGTRKTQKSRAKENVLILRAAAHSLGQIASGAGVPALISALEDEKTVSDVRREAAAALGSIGNPSAVPALRKVLAAQDPYLSRAAFEALSMIARRQEGRPG